MEEFETLFRRYYEDLYAFLMRLTGWDPTLAEELTQETFYRAFMALPDFRGQCQWRTWLIQIAKNCFYQTMRKRWDPLPLHALPAEPPAPGPSPEISMEERELLLRARILIDQMQPAMRDVMLYRIYTDLPYAQIAALLSISESSAKVLFHRGKHLLRTQLKEAYGYEI